MWVKNKKEEAGLRGHNADELKSPRRGLAYAVEMFVQTSRSFFAFVSMILPQVHLRKPCYDFSFLEMFRFKQL